MAVETTAIITLIASGVSAAAAVFVAVRVGRRSGSQKIAELRERWIDDLREDIATVLSMVTKNPTTLTTENLEKLLIAQTKIDLRLNPGEKDHVELSASLHEFIDALHKQDMKALSTKHEEARSKAKAVLRKEWQVVKQELRS